MAGTKRGMPYERTGPFPLDDTFVLSKAEMLTVDDLKMPDVYFAACSDDKKFYMYDKSATPSAETGKFKVLEGGGSGNIVELTQAEYDALTDEQKMDGTVYFIKDAVGGSTLIKSNWGVAKSGVVNVPIANQQGSFTISIADLGIASADDYNVVLSIVGGTGSGAWGDSTVFAYGRTTSAINGSVNTLQGDIQSVLVSYVVVAKGYGGGGGGGGKTYTAGNGINITNTEISVDTSVVQEKLESGTSIKTVVGESLLGSGNIPLPVYVGSGWGVAKTGSGTVPAASGSRVYNSTSVDISDLGFTGANDYQVVICPALDQSSQNVSVDVSVIGKSATAFTVKALATNANSTLSFAVPFLYTVFAKGYGGVPNGGTTGQTLVKKSNSDGDTEWAYSDMIPYVGQPPIVVGKFDLRGDGEYRDVKRVRLWISDLKNSGTVFTPGWTESGVNIRPLRVYGAFTLHTRGSIFQLPIPYSGFPTSTAGVEAGLNFYVQSANNKLVMDIKGQSAFSTEDFAQVIIDYIETPIT